MLGVCKFCPLLNTDDVDYDVIVEAIMQIALSLTTKHNSDKIRTGKMLETIQHFQKTNEELIKMNQHLQQSLNDKMKEEEEVDEKVEEESKGEEFFTVLPTEAQPGSLLTERQEQEYRREENEVDDTTDSSPPKSIIYNIKQEPVMTSSISMTSQYNDEPFLPMDSKDSPSMVTTSDKLTNEIVPFKFSLHNNILRHNDVGLRHNALTMHPYRCGVCKTSFPTRLELEKHIVSEKHKDLLRRSHDKIFSCNFCHKKFSRKQELTRHLFTHSKDKPYSCNICNKGFVRRDRLAKHKLRHVERNENINMTSSSMTSSSLIISLPHMASKYDDVVTSSRDSAMTSSNDTAMTSSHDPIASPHNLAITSSQDVVRNDDVVTSSNDAAMTSTNDTTMTSSVPFVTPNDVTISSQSPTMTSSDAVDKNAETNQSDSS